MYFVQCRRIATRYDKLAANYPAFIKLASIHIRLRAYEAAPGLTPGVPRHDDRRLAVAVTLLPPSLLTTLVVRARGGSRRAFRRARFAARQAGDLALILLRGGARAARARA
jgi:hypothetical protein